MFDKGRQCQFGISVLLMSCIWTCHAYLFNSEVMDSNSNAMILNERGMSVKHTIAAL